MSIIPAMPPTLSADALLLLLWMRLPPCSSKIIIRIAPPRPSSMAIHNLPFPLALGIASLIPKILEWQLLLLPRSPLSSPLRRRPRYTPRRWRVIIIIATTSIPPSRPRIRIIMRPRLLLVGCMMVRMIIVHRPRRRPLSPSTHPKHLPCFTLWTR